jgi:4-hydroxybenzoate polyprenyltransferase
VALGLPFLLCATLYLTLNILYSFRLKEIVILDVLSISIGFVLRAVAGGKAIAVPVSDWLLVCTLLLAMFLALAKRRHELVSLTTSATGHRKILAEYSPYLLDQMISVVTASCLTAYGFYSMAPDTVQ